jgi:host factor-I protein
LRGIQCFLAILLNFRDNTGTVQLRPSGAEKTGMAVELAVGCLSARYEQHTLNHYWHGKEITMESKTAQNIQDTFLNTVRKDKSQITVYLVSGVKLTGRIRSFDKYSVLLENNNQEQLIFKHAISTVVSGKPVLMAEHRHGPMGTQTVGAAGAGHGPTSTGTGVASAPVLTPSSFTAS